MKKLNVLLAALVGIVSFGACMKDDGDAYNPQTEIPILAHYVDSLKSIGQLSSNVKLDDRSQIWYDVIEQGDGEYKYTLDTSATTGQVSIRLDTIYAAYEGRLLNGHVFDSKDASDNFRFNFAGVLAGWIYALTPSVFEQPAPLKDSEGYGVTHDGISKGGKIRVIMPSVYGYGSQGAGSIPPNSPLDFTIEVLDIKPLHD